MTNEEIDILSFFLDIEEELSSFKAWEECEFV